MKYEQSKIFVFDKDKNISNIRIQSFIKHINLIGLYSETCITKTHLSFLFVVSIQVNVEIDI